MKELRNEYKLYQRDVAKILGITQQLYHKYEKGSSIIPLDKLIILADYYKTSIDYLLYRTDERLQYRISKKHNKIVHPN